MFKKFNLKQKVTALLAAILIAGLMLSGFALSTVLRQNARNEITSTALLLMETMSSVRTYTNTEVKPELQDKLETEFLPETIPAYSAREVFEILRTQPTYKEFFYKEATLNPTNLRDKANDFETTIVERFRKDNNLKELRGFHSTSGGNIFYIARPLAITEESCLECHSTPEAAPKSQIERYGTANGFGWKLNEIVGAQMISVPSSTVIQKANQYSFLIIGIVFLVFIAIILLINVFLHRQVVRPLKRITRIAEEVSTGHMDVNFPNFDNQSHDEIGHLAQAFKRMKLSLEMAMNRLKRSSGRSTGGSTGGSTGESTSS